ncbi:hypothetical protein [Herbaspirillum autotrophicum]|uniref:hypothetical protein n=1 Tax=Herbaspirillum autotrophicum TaxID=180195 RepID=UPI00067C5CA5|nr:hypothetical protein [Herbaspirillum autotrophicum]
MKKFSLCFLISLFVMAIITAAINFYLDPSGIFKNANSKGEFRLAKAFSEKHQNVAIGTNYDERLFQKFRMDWENLKPEVVVVGSSRSMQISSGAINAAVLNFSVSSASIEDLIALSLSANSKFRAKRYVIGVDPWMFNESFTSSRWESISPEYIKATKTLHIDERTASSTTTKYLQLVNYEYTKQSLILSFKKRRSAEMEFFFKDDDISYPNLDLIRVDGSRIYNSVYAGRSPEEVQAIARKLSTSKDTSFADFRISKSRLEVFFKLINFLKENAEVSIFFAPFHPAAYPSLEQQYPQIGQIEQLIRAKFLKVGHVQLIGSFDPKIANCQQSEFFDGMHPKATCIQRMFIVGRD